jgi:hypothetical protein
MIGTDFCVGGSACGVVLSGFGEGGMWLSRGGLGICGTRGGERRFWLYIVSMACMGY